MLKERARLLNLSVFSIDLALVAVAFVAAHWLRSAVLPSLAHGSFPGELYALRFYLPLLPVALSVWGLLLLRFRRYRSHRTTPLLREAWEVVQVSSAAIVTFTLLLYVLRRTRGCCRRTASARRAADPPPTTPCCCWRRRCGGVLARTCAAAAQLPHEVMVEPGRRRRRGARCRHAWWGSAIGCVEVDSQQGEQAAATVVGRGAAGARAPAVGRGRRKCERAAGARRWRRTRSCRTRGDDVFSPSAGAA